MRHLLCGWYRADPRRLHAPQSEASQTVRDCWSIAVRTKRPRTMYVPWRCCAFAILASIGLLMACHDIDAGSLSILILVLAWMSAIRFTSTLNSRIHLHIKYAYALTCTFVFHYGFPEFKIIFQIRLRTFWVSIFMNYVLLRVCARIEEMHWFLSIDRMIDFDIYRSYTFEMCSWAHVTRTAKTDGADFGRWWRTHWLCALVDCPRGW